MKRAIITATVVGVALAGTGLASAKPGHGAQKSGLAAASGFVPFACQSAAAGTEKQTALGFAVLNAPGKPGSPHKIVGEISVTSATPGLYNVRLADGTNGSCGTKVATLTVDQQGHGSTGITTPTAHAGSYYVILSRVPSAETTYAPESYASAPVQLD